MVARNSVGLSMALALLAAGSLSGCGGLKDALGANKYPPDEFAVVSKRALVIPPDYNLRPPGPNAPKPKEADPAEMALMSMFPQSKQQVSISPAEQQMLKATGGSSADADVRSDLSPEGNVVNKGNLTEPLLNGETSGGTPQTTIQREAPTQSSPDRIGPLQ